ncbi:MAG TPA: DUF4349 domain-containing protein [Acidobacteriaceae bacterium]|jgi:hypothetical protein
MSSLEHTFVPEEIMAFVDGELPAAEMRAIKGHLDGCEECAALAKSFRATSLWMARWDVEDIPADVERDVIAVAAVRESAGKDVAAKPRRLWMLGWKVWAGGGLTAVVALVCAMVMSAPRENHMMSAYVYPDKLQESRPAGDPGTHYDYEPTPAPPKPAASAAIYGLTAKDQPGGLASVLSEKRSGPPLGGGGGQHSLSSSLMAPMIARTAALTVAVKSLDSSRASLERILAVDDGYVAQLSAAHAEDGPPTFQASLRIPADRLGKALVELKSLGRTVTETQGGEEVTQQHMDLAARLHNARETEERYRAILAQHTGKVEDILDVEEHIAEVRGQIEQMEAEQAALDHRVDFATVDVQLTQEFKAPLNAPADSVSVRLHNGLVAGYRHVADTLLGLLLFGEEYGPALVLWLAILGVPLFLVARRYRRIRRRAF